nr:TetR/AcrR family transcriptional regulator [Pseudomonas sp.]
MPQIASRQRKGDATRAAILDAALRLAGGSGIDALTIGVLAQLTNMSKSGVFAHFGSREDLQLAVVQEYHQRFQHQVFEAAMSQPRGLARLQALIDNWIRLATHEIAQGCIYMSGAFEYDDRPGPVRDALVQSLTTWRSALVRACQQAMEQGEMQDDTDAEQLVFELMGLMLALHHDARFLKRADALERASRGMSRLITQYRVPQAA